MVYIVIALFNLHSFTGYKMVQPGSKSGGQMGFQLWRKWVLGFFLLVGSMLEAQESLRIPLTHLGRPFHTPRSIFKYQIEKLAAF